MSIQQSKAHPFTKPNADVIFTSSDGVQFRAHKIILSEASSFFDGRSCIPVTETSTVLENLLRLCYPIDDPLLVDIESVRATLEAAMKYDMQEAIKLTKTRLINFIHTAPLRVYAIACRLLLEDVALASANEVVRKKVQAGFVPEMDEIPAGAYYRLLQHGKEKWSILFPRYKFCTAEPSSAKATASFQPTPSFVPKLDASFFALSAADLILRSSNLVDFRVHRAFLGVASPALIAKIPPPGPLPFSLSSTSKADIPVIVLEEDSQVVSTLLQIYYPNGRPDLGDLQGVCGALVAAEKYAMEKAIQILRIALESFNDVDPLRLYFAACRFGLKQLAIRAAKRSLGKPVDHAYYPELDSGGVSAGTYHRLMDYHRKCQSAALALTTTREWILPDWLSLLDRRCSGHGEHACWFNPYMKKAKEALVHPFGSSVNTNTLISSIVEKQFLLNRSRDCACTSSEGIISLLKFSEHFAQEVDRVVGQVKLEPPCASAPPNDLW
ncbi:hypothetical protein A0H81_06318 [Grifola frondosa]|uniref:BTB domain-containing protein n=1 Tax=Grifola frondosa TaxID=5627 RepID=A0A1C7MG49_GRIFR|nr:hypothetical protein A0H81_06318 [Grifola frondosa]